MRRVWQRIQRRFAEFAAELPLSRSTRRSANSCPPMTTWPLCSFTRAPVRPDRCSGWRRSTSWCCATRCAGSTVVRQCGRARAPADQRRPVARRPQHRARPPRGARQTIATRSTQTNEVNRCVYLAAALALAAGGAGVAGGTGAEDGASRGSEATAEAVALVELGASAGLLLGLDRYDVELSAGRGTSQLGRAGSPVRCRGTDRTTAPIELPRVPPIAGRVGIDRHPVRLDDADAVRWLLACLWPDVPGRVERFTAARDLLLPSRRR